MSSKNTMLILMLLLLTIQLIATSTPQLTTDVKNFRTLIDRCLDIYDSGVYEIYRAKKIALTESNKWN